MQRAMDLTAVVRFYIDKMLREVPGMKVLLLDADTTRSVSTVYSQSEILEQEVYLVERLDADKGEQLFHLKVLRGTCQQQLATWINTKAVLRPVQPGLQQAVCFLRPTRENVARIRRELRDPRYGEYNLCKPYAHVCSCLAEEAAVGVNTASMERGAVLKRGVPYVRSLHQPFGGPAAAGPGRGGRAGLDQPGAGVFRRLYGPGPTPLRGADPAHARRPATLQLGVWPEARMRSCLL